MREAEWLECKVPSRMLMYLKRSKRYGAVATDRKIRLYFVACCLDICKQTDNTDLQQAVEAAERFADGLVSQKVRGASNSALRLAIQGLKFPQDDDIYAALLVARYCLDKSLKRRLDLKQARFLEPERTFWLSR